MNTSAAHIPRTRIADDQSAVLRLESGGRVLGAFGDSVHQQQKIQLKSGDRLLLFTDGVTEVRNTSGEEFGEVRLREFLAREHRRSGARLRATTIEKVSEFCGDQFDDDAALMVVQILEPAVSDVRLFMEALRTFVTAFAVC